MDQTQLAIGHASVWPYLGQPAVVAGPSALSFLHSSTSSRVTAETLWPHLQVSLTEAHMGPHLDLFESVSHPEAVAATPTT